jgi:hypothetical protein
VLAALSQQIGAKVAGERLPPNLPARSPEKVSDPLFEGLATGCAYFGGHNISHMATIIIMVTLIHMAMVYCLGCPVNRAAALTLRRPFSMGTVQGIFNAAFSVGGR